MSRYSNSVLTLAGGLLAIALLGCATGREISSAELQPRDIKEVKRAGTLAPRDTARPKIALVLGGGGLRGFAHVGVLRAVEEFGIKPDLIVGTSAGAVVGAAYASGLSPDQVRSAALDVSIPSLIDLTWSRSGLIRGRNLASWIDEVTGGARVETFPRRFAAVSTDLKQGRAVLLDAGPAGSVVRASSAVPGMNVPVPYPGGHLVDGGVTSLVPVRFARALGAEVVIAVDIYCREARPEGTGIVTVLSGVMKMQSCLLAEPEMAQADLLIAPEIAVPTMSSREAREQVIRAGYEAASTALGNWQKNAVFANPRPPKGIF